MLEALRAGRYFERIYVSTSRKGKSIQEILTLAKAQGMDVRFEPKERIEKLTQQFQEHRGMGVEEYGSRGDSSTHPHTRTSTHPYTHTPTLNTQGILGITSPYRYYHFEELWKEVQGKKEPPFLVALDGIEDPYNLGAIIRSAEGAGAHGVILPKRRSVGLTPTVIKTAAGALEYLPVCQVSNLASALEQLKKYGIWIYGAVPRAGDTYDALDLEGPLALVIGGEFEGLRELTLKKCDFLLSIPLHGKIESLNASVAAAILMFEIRRQRRREEVVR
jgi:23S rRNA (guanosine2251-2'-O)-methyltransferase